MTLSAEQLLQRFRHRLAGPVQQGVLWNLAALGVVAVSGILLNVLIVRFYDLATLGIFSLVYAVYIVCSQFAVGGMHVSVLRSVAQHGHDSARCATVIRAGLLAVLIPAVPCAALLAVAAPLIGRLMDNPQVAHGVLLAAPGLLFFSLNKLQTSALNGLRRMKAFAIVQALRALLFIGVTVALAIARVPGTSLPLIFPAAEALLLIVLLFTLRPHLRHPAPGCLTWLQAHVHFGVRGLAGGLLMQLNTRVDVLLLGCFASARLVGIYSFAAILNEGLFQILVILRNNIDPLMARMIGDHDLDALQRLTHKTKRVSFAFMSAIAVAAVLIYPLLIQLTARGPELMQGWPFFAILLGGSVLGSLYLPFAGILLAAGRPGLNSLLLTAVVCANVLGNLLLITLFQATGAAIATALTTVCWALALAWLARRVLRVWL